MNLINSKRDKPDLNYLRNRVGDSINKGIRIVDLKTKYQELMDLKSLQEAYIVNSFGIKNPRSVSEIVNCLKDLKDTKVNALLIENSTTKSNLKVIGSLGYKVAEGILMYRHLLKTTATIERLMEYEKQGFIHPIISYSKSNRINYKTPALMNIPKDILWCIIRPRGEGNILFSVDVKSQEPGIVINMLHIEQMKWILYSGLDLYNELCIQIFGTEATSETRRKVKTAWIALSYGGSENTIKRIFSDDIQAKQVWDKFSTLRELKAYQLKARYQAKEKNQRTYSFFGTPLLAEVYGQGLDRTLMNLPIQATGVDILALLVKHFDAEMVVRDLVGKLDIYYTRHDELIIEVDKQYFEDVGEVAVTAMLTDIFEHKIDDWTTFRVDVEKIVLTDLNTDVYCVNSQK